MDVTTNENGVFIFSSILDREYEEAKNALEYDRMKEKSLSRKHYKGKKLSGRKPENGSRHLMRMESRDCAAYCAGVSHNFRLMKNQYSINLKDYLADNEEDVRHDAPAAITLQNYKELTLVPDFPFFRSQNHAKYIEFELYMTDALSKIAESVMRGEHDNEYDFNFYTLRIYGDLQPRVFANDEFELPIEDSAMPFVMRRINWAVKKITGRQLETFFKPSAAVA